MNTGKNDPVRIQRTTDWVKIIFIIIALGLTAALAFISGYMGWEIKR